MEQSWAPRRFVEGLIDVPYKHDPNDDEYENEGDIVVVEKQDERNSRTTGE